MVSGQRSALVLRLMGSDIGRIFQVGIVAQLLSLISGPLSARLLGPEGRGNIALVAVVSYLCTGLASNALSVAVAHVVARYRGTARDLLGAWLRTWAAAPLVPGVIATVAAAILLRGQPDWQATALETGVITVVACWANIARACVVGEQRVRHANNSTLVYALVYVTAIVVMFVLIRHASAADVCVAMIAAQVAGLGFLAFSLKRTGKVAAVGPEVRSELLTFARRAYMSSIGTVDRLGFDNLIVGAVLGRAELGLYAVIVAVTTIPISVLSGVGTALLPRMSALDPVPAAALMRRWLWGSAGVAAIMGIGMAVVLAPAIEIFFGAAFVPAIPAGILLAITNSVGGMRYVLTAGAQAQGRAGKASQYDVVMSVGVLVAVFGGSELAGLTGAAAGLLVVNVGSVLATLSLLTPRPSDEAPGLATAVAGPAVEE